MWTPKRVGLLGIGVATFIAGYVVYVFFLGGIDGLPPLPEDYQFADSSDLIELPDLPDGEIERKLRQAFGKECDQVKKGLLFQLRKKGYVVAAGDALFDQPDGRVFIKDFNVAIFKDEKDNPDPNNPDITTVKSDYAYFKFEKAIKVPSDMNNSKLLGAELRGNILIINNRRTVATKNDDLEITVEEQPLFYEEDKGRVWSDGRVQLLDKKTTPEPTIIRGKGLDMKLARDNTNDKRANPGRGAKSKNDSSGVEQIVLKTDIQMFLCSESNNGFMGSPTKPPAPGTKPPPPERSWITITAPGPFTFDVPQDIATFTSPQSQSGFHKVHVVRKPMLDPEAEKKAGDRSDQLDCDRLVLHFRKKAETPGPVTAAKSDAAGSDREIERAEATAWPGEKVNLVMNSENLQAECDELLYECATIDRGPRTTLSGDGTVVIKDGHKIFAEAIQLQQPNFKGAGQQMIAKGPGQVDLFDKTSKKFSTHAYWKGLMTATKYQEGDRDLDLLTFSTNASFIEDVQKQSLWAQRIKLWLEPSNAPVKTTPLDSKPGDATDGPRQKPRKVEAYNDVKAETPDMRITNCTSLQILFKDAPPGATGTLPDAAGMRPASPPGARPEPATGQPLIPSLVANPFGSPPAAVPTAGPQAATAPSLANQIAVPTVPATQTTPKTISAGDPKGKEEPKRPIDLVAHDVKMDVLRKGDKNELQELVAIGDVHVHQEGKDPKDKGVDMKGDELNLQHFEGEGDLLKVYGGRQRPAQVQLNTIYMEGPTVKINQRDNTMGIEGVGYMTMPSNTTFDINSANNSGAAGKAGAKAPAAPPKETMLTVHWTGHMFFNGLDATFSKNVQAYQDDSTLVCVTMEVALDKKVSFKEGQKGDKAKVEKIIAHEKVRVEDNAKDEKTGKIVRYTRLVCVQMAVDNIDQTINASGPGTLTSLQEEKPDDSLAPKGAKKANVPAPAALEQLMLTRVDFQDRLFSNQPIPDSKSRKSTFHGNIVVVHARAPYAVPVDNLDATVEPDKLPKGAMRVTCLKLTVVDRQQPDNKTAKFMEAEGRVYCLTSDMASQSEVARFDNVTDILDLVGSPGAPARIWKLNQSTGSMPPGESGKDSVQQENGAHNAGSVSGIRGIGN